jgi:hypothetical protein
VQRVESSSWQKARNDRLNAYGLLVAAILLFAPVIVLSSLEFAKTDNGAILDSPLERAVDVNVTELLDAQIAQNGTIEGLELTLVNLETQFIDLSGNGSSSGGGGGSSGFINGSLTQLFSCPIRYGSSCSVPSRIWSQGYAAFESFRNATMTISQLKAENADFIIADVNSWSVPITFETGTSCSFSFVPDPTCWNSGFFNGAYIDYWWSYRPNPITFNCTPYVGCINPSTVSLYRPNQISNVGFLYQLVLTNGPRPVTVPISDIKMILTTTFI